MTVYEILSFNIIILLKTYYYFSKQMFKAAKKTFSEKIGIKGKNKNRDPDAFDSINDMSRFPSEDHLEVGIDDHHHGKHHGTNGRGVSGGVYESGGMCFMERHIVPVQVVQIGMSRFSFLLETSAPGTLPDPLLIAALLDLVSNIYN